MQYARASKNFIQRERARHGKGTAKYLSQAPRAPSAFERALLACRFDSRRQILELFEIAYRMGRPSADGAKEGAAHRNGRSTNCASSSSANKRNWSTLELSSRRCKKKEAPTKAPLAKLCTGF